MRGMVFSLLLAGVAMAPALLAPAGAQTAPATGLTDIVVTAEKRSESLQNTPISISALDASALEAKRVFGLSDLTSDVPNMQVSTHPNSSATLRVTIRGIGEISAVQTRDAPVAVYVDGVYVSKGQGLSSELADLERIEVLRGPQGTLYGRNATAGAINFITKSPRLEEVHAKAQVTFGSRDQFRGRTSLNIPIGKTLAAEVSYLRETKHGFVRNEGAGSNRYGDLNHEGVRAALLWQLVSEFEARYTYESSWMHDTTSYLQSVPLVGVAERARVGTTGDFVLRPNSTQVQGHNLTLSYEVGENTTLKSVTGYRKLRDETRQIYNPGAIRPYMPFNNHSITHQKQFSEELQLIGGAFDRQLEYVAGLYYFSESGDARDNGQSPLAFTPRSMDWNNKAYAVYGQATWTPRFLDSRLHLTAGGRWSKDKRKAGVFATAIPTGGVESIILDGRGKRDFSDFSPAGTIRFDVTEDVNVYAKVAKGYKTGGFNPTASSQAYFERGFGAETLVSYEAGLKSEFLNHHLRFNLAAYINKYKDIQTSVFNPFNNRVFDVINAGRATTKGFEADLTALLFEGFTLSGSYGYVNPKYTKVEDLGGNDVTSLYRFTYAPKNSFTVSADYKSPETPAGIIEANLNYSWQDRYFALANQHNIVTPRHGLLNGNIGLSDLAGVAGLRATVWAKNLTNEAYYLTHFAVGDVPMAQLGEPRSFGVDLSIEF